MYKVRRQVCMKVPADACVYECGKVHTCGVWCTCAHSRGVVTLGWLPSFLTKIVSPANAVRRAECIGVAVSGAGTASQLSRDTRGTIG